MDLDTTLDVFTLRVAAGAVIVVTAALFLLQAWDRRGEALDRLWMLALSAALASAFVTAVEAVGGGALWWLTAVGNGLMVLVPWAIWAGTRAGSGRSPLLLVATLPAVLALGVALLDGPGAGSWAGGSYYLAGIAAGSLAAAWELLTGPLVAYRSATGLGVVLGLAGVYFTMRLLLYVTLGPDSAVFRNLAGTALSTLVLVVLVSGAVVFMVALRGDQGVAERPGGGLFDPLTGAHPPWAMTERARAALRVAARGGLPLSLLRIRLDDLNAIRTAFGRSHAERAVAECGAALRAVAPAGTLVGLEEDRSGFEVLLQPASAEHAGRWARELRRYLRDVPVDVPGSRLRLVVSVGLACTAEHGHDLETLRAAAVTSLREAQREGGDRVRAAGPA